VSTGTHSPGKAAQPSAGASPIDFKAWLPLGILLLGWLAMYGPSYHGLANTIWASDEQGHGPIILGVSIWLLFRKRPEFAALERKPMLLLPSAMLLVAILAYVVGRSQSVATMEISSQILALVALVLFFYGKPGLKVAWFPLAFLVFMVPWPNDLVAAVTGPLKMAVSSVASSLLYAAGYPVGRSGVILTVGPYQLLVADACSGLNSLFTLEALGILYMNLMQYTSAARNIALALLIVPISFAANVIRVMILVLVTYHFGDEAGQGFVHGFAGMVLFIVALTLIMVTDKVIGLFFKEAKQNAA
jgi:exosortase B